MILNIKMCLEIEDNSFDEFKVLEHHIERLIDLGEWKEIKQIYNVKVREGE